MWRAVKAEQTLAAFQNNLDSWLEAFDKLHICWREFGERPLANLLLLLCRGFVWAGLHAAQHPGVGVAHDHRAGQFSQQRHRFGWLRAALDGIAQADHLIDATLAQIGQRRFKGEAVAVYI